MNCIHIAPVLQALKGLYSVCITFTHSPIHTPVTGAAMQGANQFIGSNMGFSILLGSGGEGLECNPPAAERHLYRMRPHNVLKQICLKMTKL